MVKASTPTGDFTGVKHFCRQRDGEKGVNIFFFKKICADAAYTSGFQIFCVRTEWLAKISTHACMHPFKMACTAFAVSSLCAFLHTFCLFMAKWIVHKRQGALKTHLLGLFV